jgi:HTH-type transcriptional regulator/antitoxin HigA
LNAWYARVLIKAREQDLSNYFDKNIVTSSWLFDLAKLSLEKNGPAAGIDYLKNHGIRVVIERHLESTHLDGAALLLDDLYPVIALSLRHDRVDNFWFVLFHELAHVVLHLDSQRNIIFDDLDVKKPGIEEEADKYALNAIIPDQIWKTSLARFSPSEITIKNQAKSLHIHPALIAGRIRWETSKYYSFNELVGHGEVREKLAKELEN